MPTGGVDVAALSAALGGGAFADAGAGILGGAALGGEIGAGTGGLEGLISGGNPFTDALQGGLYGAASGGIASGIGAGYTALGGPSLSEIGGGLSSILPDSGASSFLGGTPEDTADLSSSLDAAQNNLNPGGALAQDASVQAAPQASANTVAGASSISSGATAQGVGGAGGGTITPGAAPVGEDVGNTGSAISGELPNSTPPTDFAQAPTAGTESFLNNLPSAGVGTESLNPAVIQASNAATPGGTDLGLNQQSGLSKLFGGTSPIAQSGGNMAGLTGLTGGSGASPLNGLISGGLSYLLGNNNQHGANVISGAAAQANSNLAPYLATGTAAENTLGNLYGTNGTAAQTAAMNNFQTTPGYQFALGQGLNAVNANSAAMGNPLSGNNEEAINNYAQGTASQQYNNYVNQLQNLASGGMQAAGGTGANLLTGAGAQSQVGQNQANLQNNAIGTGLNALFPTGGFNLSQLLSGGNTGGGGAGILGLLGLNNGNS